MPAASVDIPEELGRLSSEFAGAIALLSPEQWDMPSWCPRWRVRDVLGHLVWGAETRQLSMFWQILRHGFRPDLAVERMGRALGDRPVPELVERLRSAGVRRSHLVGLPPELALGDLLVHSADALRPVGMLPCPPLADVTVVLDAYMNWGRRVFHAVPHRNVSLAATDSDWCHGSGPEVRGTAIDLLLVVANRRQVVECLEGPGMAHLHF